LEETKRKKLATKAEKLMELMMVSGIPTASGYEERIRFSEMEVVERGANEQGLVANAPQGQYVNGWDVNVAAVRTASVKRHLRHHDHPEYLIRVKEAGSDEVFVARSYEDFKRMHKRLRVELPGKIIPPLPRHSTSDQTLIFADEDSDAESILSNIQGEKGDLKPPSPNPSAYNLGGLRAYLPGFAGGTGAGHRREGSQSSQLTPRASGEFNRNVIIYRETSRVSLRAGLRHLLGNDRCAQSIAMKEFLTKDPITLTEEELLDIERRKELDEKRMREQQQFYEVARARAAELDVHMEKFRRDIVENSRSFDGVETLLLIN
jgi:PX domain